MTFEQAIKRMLDIKQQIRELANADDQRRRQIRDDPNLTKKAQALALENLTAENEAKRRKLMAEYDSARKVAEQHTKTVRENSNVDPQAQARVHELRRQGYNLPQQLTRAVETGDAAMLYALRAEARYFGDGKQFSEGQEIVRACDRALAQLGHTPERLVLEADEAAQGFREVAEFTAKALHGTALPEDRMRMAFALGEGKEAD